MKLMLSEWVTGFSGIESLTLNKTLIQGSLTDEWRG